MDAACADRPKIGDHRPNQVHTASQSRTQLGILLKPFWVMVLLRICMTRRFFFIQVDYLVLISDLRWPPNLVPQPSLRGDDEEDKPYNSL